MIVAGGEYIDNEIATRIEESGIDMITIRSVLLKPVLVCVQNVMVKFGIRKKRVETGDAVGIIAAQSIGEPELS